MQRHPAVGRVQRLSALASLDVDGAAGVHEARDIRDRVVHRVAAGSPLEVQRLVEVARADGVDRHEAEVAPVRGGRRRGGCRGLRFGHHLGREPVGQLERRAQLGEGGGELALRGGAGDVRESSWHAASLGRGGRTAACGWRADAASVRH